MIDKECFPATAGVKDPVCSLVSLEIISAFNKDDRSSPLHGSGLPLRLARNVKPAGISAFIVFPNRSVACTLNSCFTPTIAVLVELCVQCGALGSEGYTMIPDERSVEIFSAPIVTDTK